MGKLTYTSSTQTVNIGEKTQNAEERAKTNIKDIEADLARNGSTDSFNFSFSDIFDCCQKDQLPKRLPILAWAPCYKFSTLLKDFIAGLTVGLTAIPQGIAYAVVAGLQPQYGLYSGFMGCFVYFFFGSCKDITVGPTAIMALMTQTYVEKHGPDFAVLLAFLSGLVILFCGVLRLGFLVEFISMPVTAGFTSAAAITIASSQIKGLLGLPGNPHTFVDSWWNVFQNIGQTRLWDTVLGVSTIIVLVLTKKLKDSSSRWGSETPTKKFFKQFCSLFGLARNAVVVIAGTFLAYILSLHGSTPFKLTGPVDSGLPPLAVPPFSTQEGAGNRTMTFMEMTEEMGSALIVVPLIAILENIAIAKSFAKGKSVDATQEMIAIGLCNVAGSFVRSFPVTGSFTRTAVNHASGVVTPAGGIFTGFLVLLSLSFLTSTFYYIPKATLAGLILCAMFYMVEYHAVSLLWRTKKTDLVPMIATLLTCLLLGLEYGMLVGITVNLLFILYHSARPSVSVQWIWVQDCEVLLVTPTQSLNFPASDYLRALIIEKCSAANNTTATVIFDGSHILDIDSTIAKGLKMTVDDLETRGQEVIFWRWKSSAMVTLLGFDPCLTKYFKFEDDLVSLVKDPRTNADGHVEYEKLATTDTIVPA
ncbi:high affinity sulfate transmembrane transporter activity [Nesidiocoris tenuis]|uniref:High affinity sulfate transmembrane transporter activity n=1 Tax=Nesidiocoris tenuis TaxID=355587 RepID=A0ABN7BCV6_9HEMI|nr:high affinity sulfate transmembrane transporter activity [Nesidiocoris tenuis]